MTISEHIDNQALKLDMDHLTPDQREWLHHVHTLATWAWIAQEQRKLDARKTA